MNSCHYDPTLGERVTSQHRDDCTDPNTHDGCVPCLRAHCVVCGHWHLTNDTPQTCAQCLAKVRDDLDAIAAAYDELGDEAANAARDGRLVAAAAIPGGVAQVLRGPAVPMGQVKRTEHHDDDHRAGDAVPPLAVMAWWEDTYRAHLGLASAGRATVTGAAMLLASVLTDIAQDTAGPDWFAFTREVRALRAQLSRVLHDESAPEYGIGCFECGDRLVRRFREARACGHATPARRELGMWLDLGYPEAVSRSLLRESRRPCGECDQGGMRDPGSGLSWECPGCRREFSVGEYLHALRRDLVLGGDGEGFGWSPVSTAAEAASGLLGVPVGAATVRKWMDRGQVASRREGGGRVVFWPDVLERAQAAVERRRVREARAVRRAGGSV